MDKKKRKKYAVRECMVWIKIWVLAAFHFQIIMIKPNFYYTSHRLKNKCTCNTLIFLGKPISAFKSPDETIRAGLIEEAENSVTFSFIIIIIFFLGGGGVYFLQSCSAVLFSFGVLPHSKTIAADTRSLGLIHSYCYMCFVEWRPFEELLSWDEVKYIDKLHVSKHQCSLKYNQSYISYFTNFCLKNTRYRALV